jgi:lipid-binding SYLF domain-containing protein
MSGFVSRWKNDASNAMEDIYGSIMLGDDAGQADRLVVILQPPPAIFLGRSFGKRMWNTLGVCFCNIQNRAYVQQVEEGSPADLQGVSVKDCVQYAAVLAKEWQNPLTSDLEDISKQALERESSGQRISYLDLRRILERGMENTQTSFLSPPSVPTTISVGHSSSGANRDTDLATPRPLVLVLRRTKQRSTFSRSFNIWPRFRLDDECDVATQIIVNLASSSTDAHKQGSVEASTIRDMIQTCHGIAFLRQNKLALGLSFHGGSGIILAKLEDGSWSPPSAIGTFGMGVALGVGACVEHTLIVMQTKQACEHFMRGASFQIGVGLGAALFGIGREAMGSANMSGALCGSTHILEFTNEDEYDTANVQSSKNSNDTEQVSNAMIHGVTPMMAYAMSEGLYFGVSLGGTKIHTRHDVNGRTYQFLATSSQNDISPQEILQAKVPMPLEARKLVASLIATEFQHELQHLPKIQSLVKKNCWHFLSPSLEKDKLESSKVDAVREFFFGGVAVIQEPKEKPRTLWMYLPGMDASLEIGFISSLSERKCSLKQPTRAHINNISDALSTASEDLTLDSTLIVSEINFLQEESEDLNIRTNSDSNGFVF